MKKTLLSLSFISIFLSSSFALAETTPKEETFNLKIVKQIQPVKMLSTEGDLASITYLNKNIVLDENETIEFFEEFVSTEKGDSQIEGLIKIDNDENGVKRATLSVDESNKTPERVFFSRYSIVALDGESVPLSLIGKKLPKQSCEDIIESQNYTIKNNQSYDCSIVFSFKKIQ